MRQLESADSRGRARILGVLGRIATSHPEPEFTSILLRSLEDDDERVRRVASGALAKLEVPGLEARLLARWDQASELERRSLAEALGKRGGERAFALLAELKSADPELRRIAERARLMIERDAARALPSAIALDRPLGAPQSVLAHCRSGIAWVLAEEARNYGTATVVL